MSKVGSIAVALAVIAGVLLTGCGGGGGGTEALTKAEFEKQAGAVCKEAEEKRVKLISALVQQADPKGDVEAQQEQLIKKAMPTYEEAAQQINDLGAPEGQEKKVEALVEAMEEAAEKSISDPHTAVISNIFFRKADQLAQEFKLAGCVI